MEFAEAYASAQVRWIAVSERLPSLDGKKNYAMHETVICLTESGHVIPMEWSANPYAKTEKGKAARWEWQGRISPWNVTYWMPLPDAPEGDQG